MHDELYEEIFEAGALSSTAWLTSASRLKHAADILFDRYEVERSAVGTRDAPIDLAEMSLGLTATLIYGFAMENALKAVAVKKSPALAQGGNLRKWPSDGHDQSALASMIGLSLTAAQEELLASLTAFVRWAGRYPVPKKPSDMPLRKPSSMFALPPAALAERERDEFDKLYAVLCQIVVSD